MEYLLKNTNLEVTFKTLGAEMISVKYKGKERLWQNDNNTWSGHAPILFPLAGFVDYILDNKKYPITKHGFARNKEFKFVSMNNNSITFKLESDDETLSMFPFEFDFFTTYTLNENKIEMVYVIINKSENTMYTSCGGHTSFSFDNDISNYELVFENQEHLVNLDCNNNGHLTKEVLDLGNTDTIDCATDLLKDSKTIILKDVTSKKVTLREKNGKDIASIEYKDFPFILFWHPIDSKMLCMEPWHNLPDITDNDTRCFNEKEGIIEIHSKESKEFHQVFEYYD